MTVANAGNIAASGILSISLSASTTGSTAPTDLLPIATLSKKVNLKSGKSIKLTFNQQIASIPAGSYFFVATLDAANAFNDSNLAKTSSSAPRCTRTMRTASVISYRIR